MKDYQTIDIAPEEVMLEQPQAQTNYDNSYYQNNTQQSDPYADFYAQQQMQIVNNGQIANDLLNQIRENQEKEIKFLKSITTNTSILAAVIVIQIIATLLMAFRR